MPDNLPQVSVSDIDSAPLNSAAVPVSPDDVIELRKRFTEVSDENFALKSEVETLKKKVKTAEILDALIQPYAGRAFWFMCCYCGFVGLLLLLSGWPWFHFSQPKEVITLMVGSTAVTVIGLVGMVLTGIFVGARKGGGV